jgi:hypothetical protein
VLQHARVLHVTNGDGAAAKLRGVVDGEVLPWRDALHDGPVPPVAPDELRAVRARHLAARFGVDERRALADMEARDGALLGAERVVLWFEHDLYDQLQLLQVLSLRGDVEAAVAGGFLIDADLRALRPARVTDADVAAARRAWEAFTGEDPRAWSKTGEAAASGARGAPLRFLAAALRRLAEELPWSTDGLSRSERQLRAAGGDFAQAQRAEEAPFLGDALAEAILRDGHGEWLGGVRRDAWRWDPARAVASPA